MGGAFGALGGDLSSISNNPAVTYYRAIDDRSRTASGAPSEDIDFNSKRLPLKEVPYTGKTTLAKALESYGKDGQEC